MKIGIVVRILWSAGTQKFAIDQALALKNAGHDVTIFFLRKTKNSQAYEELLKTIDYKILTTINQSKLTPFYDFITGIFIQNRKGDGRVDYNLLRQFPSYIKDMGFNYLICQDQWAGLAGYYSSRKLGVKYAVVIHEQVNNFPWMKGVKRIFAFLALRFQRKILYNADRIFTLTVAVAKTVDDFYKGKLNVNHVFPGLKNNIVFNYTSKKNQILMISYWNEIKVPEVYIPLFKEIEGYNFVIAGNWISQDYRNNYFEKLRQEGVLNKITFIDNMPETQKLELFHESKFYVRFGFQEKGPGYGTIEALEAGLPVICNTDLGISDYLNGNSFALVLNETSDLQKIRDFILANEDVDKYSFLQREIESMLKKFTWKRHASELLQIITDGKNAF